jgi:SAM-dependent methyltransferase
MSKARLVITAVVTEKRPVSEVARDYKVARSWVCALLARYQAEGEAASEPRPRRPRTSPRAIGDTTAGLITGLRKDLAGQGLDAGPQTIAWHLRHRHQLTVSPATISWYLTRAGLADRLAAGSAEIVLGDAGQLPWDDGRFSIVTSLNTLKFVPDPEGALREMCRVLRPGGRVVVTMGETKQASWGGTDESGTADAWGQWQWSDADAQRLTEAAGFADIAVSVLRGGFKLVRGTKPVVFPAEEQTRSAAGQR